MYLFYCRTQGVLRPAPCLGGQRKAENGISESVAEHYSPRSCFKLASSSGSLMVDHRPKHDKLPWAESRPDIGLAVIHYL